MDGLAAQAGTDGRTLGTGRLQVIRTGIRSGLVDASGSQPFMMLDPTSWGAYIYQGVKISPLPPPEGAREMTQTCARRGTPRSAGTAYLPSASHPPKITNGPPRHAVC
ncbi:hypothetical protein LY76DRAFT_116583 [Colletotrichum caudatum]|nr:hypothetical protein LY76DRAFT_116583 [Colletotrichum caudatum]